MPRERETSSHPIGSRRKQLNRSSALSELIVDDNLTEAEVLQRISALSVGSLRLPLGDPERGKGAGRRFWPESRNLTAVSSDDTIEDGMGPKHRPTLEAIFENPVRSNISWRGIEAMLEAAGAEITEGAGSRVRIALNGVRAVFHRPHPQKETDRGAVKSMRRFLAGAGVTP